MLIRRETPADIETVQAVTTAAFTDGRSTEPVETGLLARLRKDPGWLPGLSLVAQAPSGEVIGHVVCTRGLIGTTPVLGLGPISVLPDRQRAGAGSALMHTVIGAAEALDEPLIALLGDPAYYTRFGFAAGAVHHIDSPDPAWGRHFQVRPLSAHSPDIRGTFRYAEPFNDL